MNRITQVFGTALLAGTLIGGVQAADPQAGGGTVQPGGGGAAMEPSPGADTTVRDLDTTTQRAHSPTAPGAQPQDADKKAQTQGGGQGAPTGAAGGTRDFSMVDTNDDNLGSPEEYEKALSGGKTTAR